MNRLDWFWTGITLAVINASLLVFDVATNQPVAMAAIAAIGTLSAGALAAGVIKPKETRNGSR